MTTGPDREAVARFLAQRIELGAGDAIFEDRTRLEALAAAGLRWSAEARAARQVAAASGAAVAPAPPSARSARPVRTHRDASAASVAPGDLPQDHDELRSLALGCTRCKLCEGRTQVVFADGSPTARVMVVGEAPGANEDKTGLPFVGAAGKLLDLLLASVDLSRKTSVYIANVIKCRPPGNRNPLPEEIAACSPFLRRQVEIVKPEAILAVGTFAAQLLTGTDRPIGELRRKVHSYEGTPLVVTYHPAALLRNSSWTRATWEDLQVLCRILDAGVAAAGSGAST